MYYNFREQNEYFQHIKLHAFEKINKSLRIKFHLLSYDIFVEIDNFNETDHTMFMLRTRIDFKSN
jgi:hypothetical protein